ncbi:MAG: hypothetical protein N2748_04515 [candidate division WOR-3 bacterium]|nr:hypothetical protein [candidate division WOR-3 bacterium]
MKKFIIIIVLFTGILIFSVWLHHYSIALTQEVVRLQKELQLLKEEVTRLEIEQNRVFLWTNLENRAQELNLISPPNNKTKPNSILNTELTKNITVNKNND